MQRQAGPLLRPEAPVVGTGLEGRVARDSRALINAEGEGVVEYVDAEKIVIRYDRTDKQRLVSFVDDPRKYVLTKFKKTNQNTCINLNHIVKKENRVPQGKEKNKGKATTKGK